MTTSVSEFLKYGLVWLAYLAWTDILFGILLAAWIGPRVERDRERQSTAAFALLVGVTCHLVIWGALRWVRLSYFQIQAIHTGLLSLMALGFLRKSYRTEVVAIGRTFLSREVGVFFAVACAAAALLTYGPIEKYYADEILRLGFASAALRDFPAQSPWSWSGTVKYHYLGDFYAATVSGNTAIPLPVFYFRYFLLSNWLMLYIGLRGIVAQMAPGASRMLSVAAFALLFLAHGNQVTHLTFRENTFSLGIIVLGMSTLWSAFHHKNYAMLIVASSCVGLSTFAKAPGGCLYAAFVCSTAMLFFITRRINILMVAVAGLLVALGWHNAYRLFLNGGDFMFSAQDYAGTGGTGAVASAIAFGPGVGSLHLFMPEALALPAIRHLPIAEIASKIPGFWLLDNWLSLAYFGMLPLLACVAYGLKLRLQVRPPRCSEQSLVLLAGLAVFGMSGLLYSFMHYPTVPTSDRYWIWFGLWILSAVAYPALAIVGYPSGLPRLFSKFATAAVAVSLALSVLRFWPATRRLATSNWESWTPGQQRACDYLREHSALENLYLHNQLSRLSYLTLAMCGRRMFTVYVESPDDFAKGTIYERNRDEAQRFFAATMPEPLEWLRRYGIRWIYWDKTLSNSDALPEFANYSFLKRVFDNDRAALFEVSGQRPMARFGEISQGRAEAEQ